MDLSIRVIAFNTFCDRSHFASRHPHLSVVQVFKDRFRRAVSFDSSAAERRDYEEPSKLRQALRTTFFNLPSPPTPPETPGTAERCALYTHLNRSQAGLGEIPNPRLPWANNQAHQWRKEVFFVNCNATDTYTKLGQPYPPIPEPTSPTKKAANWPPDGNLL